MQNPYLPLSDSKNYEYGYKLAYQFAGERLAKIGDIEQQCRQTGASLQVIDSKRVVVVKYLDRSYLITLSDVGISLMDSGEKVPLRDKVLILHYFTLAKGIPATDKLITYKELPEGFTYFSTFAKRAIKPLVDYFGSEPHRLLDAAAPLGGRRADYGDVAVTINAFSRVSIILMLWQGDAELAPEGNILFDTNISDYLPTEDITVLCEIIAWKMVKYLRRA